MVESRIATGLWFLVGFMGAGKTTLGREVAKRMDLPFYDLDELIERSSGRTVAEIFASEGEAGFRRRETEALARLVSEARPAIVATGGGAFTGEDNRRLMKEAGTVVWIDVPLPEILTRVGRASRPLWTTPEEVTRLHERRCAAYREADHHLLLEKSERGEAAERLLHLLARHRTDS